MTLICFDYDFRVNIEYIIYNYKLIYIYIMYDNIYLIYKSFLILVYVYVCQIPKQVF